MRKTLSQLLSPWIDNHSEIEMTGIENDSRRVKSGDLFIAYPGAASDGRSFIPKVVAAGAVAIVYEPEHFPEDIVLPESIPCIAFPKVALHLAGIASRFYNDPSKKLSVTGITGTNGKTTVAYQLAQAYELLGQKAAYIGTIGCGPIHALQPSLNTTPDALRLQSLFAAFVQQGIQQVCMEVSSHALHQHRVDGIQFEHAIFTNLSHEHLDYHHTIEAYAEAKAMLFAWPTLKSAVFNQDDAYSDFMAKPLPASCQTFTYGLTSDATIFGKLQSMSMQGSMLSVHTGKGDTPLRINHLGQFNVYNALAVYASLFANGIDPLDIVNVVQQVKASPGRMEVVLNEPCMIVDYAHTPDALKNVLTTLTQLKRNRIGVVFGCGGDRDKEKRPMMAAIASEYADWIIITTDNPRTEDPLQIMREVAIGLTPDVICHQIVDRREAILFALQHAEKDDLVVIAGKGHESYQEVGHQRFDFSDQQMVRELSKVNA